MTIAGAIGLAFSVLAIISYFKAVAAHARLDRLEHLRQRQWRRPGRRVQKREEQGEWDCEVGENEIVEEEFLIFLEDYRMVGTNETMQ